MTGYTAITLAVVGAATSAAGAIQQGKSQKAMGAYNAKVANNQAIAAQQKAAFDEDRQRQQARLFAGKQRAGIASAGGEQSDAGDVLSMTAEEAEIDALAIRYGGDIAAQSARQSGVLAKAQGDQAAKSSYFKAGSTLLTAGAKAYGGMSSPTSTSTPNYSRVSAGGGRRDASGFIG